MSTGFEERTISRDVHAQIVRGFHDALMVQDASNGSGILASAERFKDSIWADLQHAPHQSTVCFRKHPIFVLYASKLHDMAGLGLSDSRRYGLAYNFASLVKSGIYDVGTARYRELLAEYYDEFDKLD